MNVLVTGGVGYIGSHTAVELINKGFNTFIIDNLSNSNIEVLEAIKGITKAETHFVKLDLCNKADVLNFFSKNKIDAIIHFAAYKAVGESVENPLKYYHNNILSLLNLLEAVNKIGIGKFVFSSSCSVYGDPDYLPIKEDAPFGEAKSPYAHTKQIGEEILRNVTKASNLKVITLRYFNPIGAHGSALIGELPIGTPSNLVPLITQTAVGKRETLNVYGNDYDTPDGSCIRDYIHVVDIAKAHVVAMERLLNNNIKSSFEIFNLGTGKGTSVFEIVKTFERVAEKKLNYKIASRRAGDVVSVYADTSLANQELGWYAEKNLEEMLLSAWQWEIELNKKSKNEKPLTYKNV